MLELDLVSDPHIDQWDSTLPNLYPCGEIKTFPFVWTKVVHSNILIVAGDVSEERLSQVHELIKDQSINTANYNASFAKLEIEKDKQDEKSES